MPGVNNKEHPDGLNIHETHPKTYDVTRLTGLCTNGHVLRMSGFIDSQGKWRCRLCRKEQSAERDYWRLLKRYMNGDATAQEALERRHGYRFP